MSAEPTSARKIDATDAPDLPWSRVRDRLDQGMEQAPDGGGPNRHTAWLATIGPSGAPHVRPLGAMWVDGAFYFTAGTGTQKAKNLVRNPAASISIATQEFDVTVDGHARRVTDIPTLERVAKVYADGGWPAEVDVDAQSLTAPYSAPSAGPAPWDLWVLEPKRLYANSTIEGWGFTRFDF